MDSHDTSGYSKGQTIGKIDAIAQYLYFIVNNFSIAMNRRLLSQHLYAAGRANTLIIVATIFGPKTKQFHSSYSIYAAWAKKSVFLII